MMVRTQISLPAEEHRRAKRRAAELNVSLAEYVRRTLARDLGDEPSRGADTQRLFALGESGRSDVASTKDRRVADAVRTRHAG